MEVKIRGRPDRDSAGWRALWDRLLDDVLGESQARQSEGMESGQVEAGRIDDVIEASIPDQPSAQG